MLVSTHGLRPSNPPVPACTKTLQQCTESMETSAARLQPCTGDVGASPASRETAKVTLATLHADP